MKMKRRFGVVPVLFFTVLGSLWAGGNQQGGGTDKPVELVWSYVTWGMTPADNPKVEAAINEYLAPKGLRVKLQPVGIAERVQKQTLTLSSPSEPLDLFTLWGGSELNSAYQRGQIIPLDDLIQQYGKELEREVGQTYLSAGKVNGEIYGVPSLKDQASNFGFVITKEYVDKYNIDLSKVKTIQDITPILALIKQNEPDFYPFIPNSLTIPLQHDTLGNDLGVLIGDNYNVVNLYESKEYRDLAALVRSWYQAGYIRRDAATVTENNLMQVRANTGCAYFTYGKPGVEMEDAVTAAHELLIVDFHQAFTATSSLQTVMWAIPLNSKHPDKAMQLMNLLYSDPVLINLIDWGIEGTHYVKKPDGTITYPAGMTAANSPYMLNMTWQLGNQFLSHVWEGLPPNYYETLRAFNNSAKISPAMGFFFDTSRVQSQISALTAVVEEYNMGFTTGSLDLSVLDEFNAKLKAAGLNDVIVEKQRQLDAWRTANKK
ncbi:MAG: ABC transporter substrate-binding protein [Treponema sp.]|jgi:putative aldouronate transport system substrate-binding protein|nr:ABC transporter substrate-binding protein [Treponema sp.]